MSSKCLLQSLHLIAMPLWQVYEKELNYIVSSRDAILHVVFVCSRTGVQDAVRLHVRKTVWIDKE